MVLCFMPLWKKKSPFVIELCHREAPEPSIFLQDSALIPEMPANQMHKVEEHKIAKSGLCSAEI